MPIQYSCVVCGTTVLCSYQTAPGPFEKLLLTRLPDIAKYRNGKTSINAGNYTYYSIKENDVTFLCTVTSDVTVVQSYAFLIQVKTLFWQGGFAARDLSSAEAHELDLEFVSVLDTQMERYSSTNDKDKSQTEDKEEESNDDSSELAAMLETNKAEITDANDIAGSQGLGEVTAVMLTPDRLTDKVLRTVEERAQKTSELEFFVEKNSKEVLAFHENAERANWLFRKKNRRMSILLGITVVFAVVVSIVIGILFGVGVLE